MSGGKTRDDELALMRTVLAVGRVPESMCALDKRGLYILGKWEARGWWDCGVTLRSGWLTDKGLAEMPAFLARAEGRL